MEKIQAWTLISRPTGMPTKDNFELREFQGAPLAEGEVCSRNIWLTVGPAMRVRMSAETRGYHPPFELGKPLPGWAIGEVVASRSPDLKEGDTVLHQLGLRDTAQGPSTAFEKLPRPGPPAEHYLNALGSTGFTAYVGIVELGKPRTGETVFVSGAAGSVGSSAVQIAKALGLRVVGSAGGSAKCDMLRELGADAAIDYKSPGSLTEKLMLAAPSGIDIYLDNVGGEHLDAALALANSHARFAISGMISTYNEDKPLDVMHHLNRIVTQSIRIEGYLALADRPDLIEKFREVMWSWIETGKIRPWQVVREGLSSVPESIEQLFAGGFAGKPLIRL